MKTNYKQYGLYLIRWQLSTPILAVALVVLATTNKLVATIVANLIGGLIFFWVDKFIFTSPLLKAQWAIVWLKQSTMTKAKPPLNSDVSHVRRKRHISYENKG